MNKFSIIFLTVFITISCKSQSQLQRINEYNSQIIGVWVSEDNPAFKIEFTNSNQFKQYIDDDLLDTLTYSISISCGNNDNNGYDIFLKITESIGDYSCDVINNISTDSQGETILSLTTERGKLEIYKKE